MSEDEKTTSVIDEMCKDIVDRVNERIREKSDPGLANEVAKAVMYGLAVHFKNKADSL